MEYLCGKDCPCGDACTNRSLTKRQGAPIKVFYVSHFSTPFRRLSNQQTGSRGFGLKAIEDIKEGTFVIDYRGEVISMPCVLSHKTAWRISSPNSTFHERIQNEYSGSRNFYALHYDQDEVIDAVRTLTTSRHCSTDASGHAGKRCTLHQSWLQSES